MPSLSIVIPYRHDSERLEETVLSVLENRPNGAEVIVVHDGSYSDPYRLTDELVFVEVDHETSVMGLINAGVNAACSPVVNTLLDGVRVTADWTVGVTKSFETSPDLAAMAAVVQRGEHTSFGLDPLNVFDSGALQRGRVLSHNVSTRCAGPEITCGFFRRRVLLALGGFNESLDVHSAQIDLAWALDELELECACNILAAPTHVYVQESQHFATQGLRQLASIASAYDVVDSSLTIALKEFVRGCLAGHPLAAYAWAAGLISTPTHSPAVRLALAKENLARGKAEQPAPKELPRRAA